MKLACAHLSLLLVIAPGCTPEAPPPPGNAGSGGGPTAGTGGRGGSGGAGNAGGPGTAGGGSGTAGMGGAGGGGAGGGGTGGGMAGSTGGSAGDANRMPDRSTTDARPGSADAPRRADGGGAGAPDVAAAVPPEGFGAGPLTECSPGPSLGRLQIWRAHGNTVPAPQSNLLVREGDRTVARVRFTAVAAPSWSEALLFVTNTAEASRDMRTSAGLTITYSAAAQLGLQIRGTVQRDGGDQHVAILPATGGAIQKRSIRFVPEDWTFLAGLGRPRQTLTDVLRTAVLFNFVGQTNELVVHDIRFDNYVPACP